MAVPIVLGIIAGVCAAGGVGNGVHGGIKMKGAKSTMKIAEDMQENAKIMCEKNSEITSATMDNLGTLEVEVLSSFTEFSELIEKIQQRPEFAEYNKNGIEIPKFQPEEIQRVSSGAALVLGGLGGAAAGTAGGFAAAGATTSLVMAVGTASTGTAISSLGGAAATNATMAFLGGGSLAAGGGGMALGTAMLSGVAAGAAVLVGGIIFNVTGCKLSKKTDEALKQAKEIENNAKKICDYLSRLDKCGKSYNNAINKVYDIYKAHILEMKRIVLVNKKYFWMSYTEEEKRLVQNTCLLVGMLYKMCKLNLVIQAEEGEVNEVNEEAAMSIIEESAMFLDEVA